MAIIFFLIIILIILGLIHFVILEGLLIGLAISNLNLIFFIEMAFIFLILSFVLSSVLSFKWNNLFTRFYYRLSVIWLGFSFYFFLASIIYLLYELFAGPSHPLAWALFIIAYAFGVYGLWNANNIRIRTESISLNGLPISWHGRKAVFVSDFHLGQVRGKGFAKRVSGIIENLKPDIVFIGGDVFDGVMINIVEAVSPLGNIRSALGTYFVMGNHEEFRDNKKYQMALLGVGIKVLNDELVMVDGLQLIGLDYKTTETVENFKNVLGNIIFDNKQATVLLKHVPLHLEVSEAAGISLQLSGHTHKAQVFPLSLLTKLIFKGYDYGFKNIGETKVYTSSGVGTWGPPFRICTSSEIVVLEFV